MVYRKFIEENRSDVDHVDRFDMFLEDVLIRSQRSGLYIYIYLYTLVKTVPAELYLTFLQIVTEFFFCLNLELPFQNWWDNGHPIP